MRLAELVGNARLVTRLGELLRAGRLAHAVILEGPLGVGRRSLALALAQAQLCHAPHDGDACGSCRSCRLVVQDDHPDLTVLPGLAERSDLPVSLLRDTVVDAASRSALLERGRAFVLPDAERMKGPAANALLKVLEEPPVGTRFLLTVQGAAGLLDTIRSRSQRFRLQALSEPELVEVLCRQGIARPEAQRRALLGGGSHRDLAQARLPDIPVQEVRELVGRGYDAHRIAALVARLPEAGAVPKGSTVAKEQRRVLSWWLDGVIQDLRRDLRGAAAVLASEDIERLLQARKDLDRYLQPRLVLEALCLQ